MPRHPEDRLDGPFKEEYFKRAGNVLDMYDFLPNDEKDELPDTLRKALDKFMEWTDA